jgi:adenylate cyclase
MLGDAWRSATPVTYRQGYLNRDKTRTVRVRIAGDAAMLTIKGQTYSATRAEFEYAIPLADAEALLLLCDGPLIEKTRRKIEYAGLVWEVDEFFGDNQGLVVAEVELTAEDQTIDKPDWIGKDVTDDARYYNSNLAMKPFNTWSS